MLLVKILKPVGGSHLGRALGCCRGEFLDRASGGTRHDGILGYEKLDINSQLRFQEFDWDERRTMPDRDRRMDVYGTTNATEVRRGG